MLRLQPCLAYAAFLIAAFFAPPACGGGRVVADEAVNWRVGKDFQQQLELPGPILWSEQSLRRGLENLSRSQRIAIWLDRRIDPDQVMTLASSRGTSLHAALQQVAAKLGVGVGSVGDVVYIGPQSVAKRLATLAARKRQATAKLPAEIRAAWQRRQPFQWEAVTSPREILDQLASQVDGEPGRLKIVQPELLAHDLWAAGDYPALPLADRLTLLLAGFELSFDLSRDGTAIRLAPMPESVSISRTFSPDNALRAEQQLAREFPDVAMERRGNRLTATGRFEDLEMMGRLLRGEKVRPVVVADADTRFDLRVVKKPVGAVVETLKQQLDLTVKMDPAVAPLLKTMVTFQVQQATLEQLLEAALKPAGVAFTLDKTVLELRPGDAKRSETQPNSS